MFAKMNSGKLSLPGHFHRDPVDRSGLELQIVPPHFVFPHLHAHTVCKSQTEAHQIEL